MRPIPLPATLREFLQDEERASSVIIWGLGGIAAIVFFAAVLAMAVLGWVHP